MEIKILGTGCGKCKTSYAVIEKVIKENNITATITKVDDIMEIMNYNILATPAVVVDGEVKIKGYVPSETRLWLVRRLWQCSSARTAFSAVTDILYPKFVDSA